MRLIRFGWYVRFGTADYPFQVATIDDASTRMCSCTCGADDCGHSARLNSRRETLQCCHERITFAYKKVFRRNGR